MKTWRQTPQGYDHPVLEAKRQEAIRLMGEQWILDKKAAPRLPGRLSDQEMNRKQEPVQQEQPPVQPPRRLKRVA